MYWITVFILTKIKVGIHALVTLFQRDWHPVGIPVFMLEKDNSYTNLVRGMRSKSPYRQHETNRKVTGEKMEKE